MGKLRQKVGLAGAAMAIALVPTGGPESIPLKERRIIEQSFRETKEYWLRRGIGVGALRLTLLNKNERAAYYNSTTDHVVINKGYIDWVGRITSNSVEWEAALRFTVGHEVGHGVQDVLGLNVVPYSDIKNSLDEASVVRHEVQADCLAGATMKALHPLQVDEASIFIQRLGDTLHGDGVSRSFHAHDGDPNHCLFDFMAG